MQRYWLFLLVIYAACASPIPEPERRYRQEREKAVRAALPPEKAASFRLEFFPYNPRYKVRGLLEAVPPAKLTIPASDGSERPAQAVGRLRLSLPEGDGVLTLYQLEDIRERYPDHLFLPFRDSLAGKETYGAGRYVEVERLPGGVVEVDFNRAYNPDCAFGLVARCPITPEENHLPFPVRAGEKLPQGLH